MKEVPHVVDALGASAPKYQRIAAAIRSDIRDGTYEPGARLPAETAMMQRFGVSLPTLRQAMSVLRSEGLIESRHGLGTFVRNERRRPRRSRHRYGAARGRDGLLNTALRHQITFAGRGPLPAHIAEAMGEDAGAEVVIRSRSLFDPDTGRLEEIGASYIPVGIAGGTYLEEPTVVPKALFRCVEDIAGRAYTHARDRWVARLATAEEATQFGITTGSPVLHVVHTATDAEDEVLEVSESVWPADRMVVMDEYDIPLQAQSIEESEL